MQEACKDMRLAALQGVHRNNAQSNQVYASLKSSNTCTTDWIPKLDESGIHPRLTLCFMTFDSFMQAACKDVRLAAVQGVCQINAQSKQVHATPKSFSTHTTD